MKSPFLKLKSKSGQHTVEYVVLMTLVMAGIIISTPYVIRSWNANLKGWDDSITDSINDPLLQSPPTGAVPTFCYCNPSEPIGCGLGVATPLGFVQCASTEMLYYSACSPIDCEYSAYPGNVRATCSTAAGCCTAWADDVCGINAIPHGDQPDGSCQDGYRLQTRTCGASAVLEYQCVVDTACNYICRDVLPTGPGYVGLCAGDDTRLSSNTWYTAVANGNCSTPAGSAPKCEVECAPGWTNQAASCQCSTQVDNTRTLLLTTTVGCNSPSPAEAFNQTNKTEFYSIQGSQCLLDCTEITYEARFSDMHNCGGGGGPVRSFKALDSMAANYSWSITYYDHGFYTRTGSGFKPAGATTVNTGVVTHQGGGGPITLSNCGLCTPQWRYNSCAHSGSPACSSCDVHKGYRQPCGPCTSSNIGDKCGQKQTATTHNNEIVYVCECVSNVVCNDVNYEIDWTHQDCQNNRTTPACTYIDSSGNLQSRGG